MSKKNLLLALKNYKEYVQFLRRYWYFFGG